MAEQRKRAGEGKLQVQYAGVHLGYWVDYLIVISFAAAVLKVRGFSEAEIGVVTGIGSGLTVLLQAALSSLADRSDRVSIRGMMMALVAAAIGAGAAMMALPHVHAVSFVGMFVAISLCNAMQPLTTALCLRYNEAGHTVNFGVARSIGSLGYALSGMVMGQVTERFGAEIVLPISCVIYALLFLLMATMERPTRPAAPSREKGQAAEASSFARFFVRYPRYSVMLVTVMLMFFMQMVLNTFMLSFVEALGGGKAEMGLALSTAAFAELPAVALGVPLVKRFGAKKLLRISAVAGAVKFVALPLAGSVRVFLALHLLHILYSGLYMVAIVYFADSIVSRSDTVKAQSILTIALTGLVGTAANLLGGAMISTVGTAAVAWIGAAASLLGAALMFVATRKKAFRGEADEKNSGARN